MPKYLDYLNIFRFSGKNSATCSWFIVRIVVSLPVTYCNSERYSFFVRQSNFTLISLANTLTYGKPVSTYANVLPE